MNTAELVAKIADAHGVSKVQAKSIVDDIMKNILDAAASGAEVSLPGFGKFKVKATPERGLWCKRWRSSQLGAWKSPSITQRAPHSKSRERFCI